MSVLRFGFGTASYMTEDPWATWVLHRRHGDDAGYAKMVRSRIEAMADRVLDPVGLAAGMTLLDIGSGEGLLPWRAIERIGPSLRVILTDVSEPLLAHARATASSRGIQAQCDFVYSGAEQLVGIGDASVDVVTSRAALAYVADKRAALAEIIRVLKPGGCLSIAEPVFRDEALKTVALRKLLDSQEFEGRDPFMELLHRWRSAQFPDTEDQVAACPLTNYTERDLVLLSQACGFENIHLQLHIDVQPSDVPSWGIFVNQSAHPWAASLATVLAERCSPGEAALIERVLRPTVESRQALTVDHVAYLQARKSAA